MEGNPLHPVAAAGAVATAEEPVRESATGPTLPTVRTPPVALSPAWDKATRGAITLGAILTVVGWLLARERASGAILLASQYALGLGLGGLFFIAFGYVTQAGWHVAFRRVPEALAGTIPLSAAFTLAALLGFHWLYEWSHADVVAKDALLQEKSAWLNTGGFFARAVIVLAVWIAFAWIIRRVSRRQDGTGNARATGRNMMWSALFLVVGALTFSIASVDWMMSLEPHWYSTVYAVYNFSGLFVSALAGMMLLLIALRRTGPLRGILRDDHLHDLAKLTFGFATFWGYIWFCQYMLIWYANIPEETVYYAARGGGAWGVLMLVNPVVNWLIPFLVLLPRPAKRNEALLVKVAVLLLVGRWLDLYLMINPSITPDSPTVGLWEIAPLLVALPLVLRACVRILARGNLVPVGDPMLGESIHHHT